MPGAGPTGRSGTTESRAVPALPASLSRPPADSYGHRDRVDSKGSGPHTLDAIAKTGKTTLGTAPQAKTGRSQGSSPAPLGVPPPPSARTPPLFSSRVPLEAPAPKPASGLGGCACSSCGPTPKPQPKTKSRKEPAPSSQPKLAEFFVAQAKKASTCSNTSQDGPTAPAQVFPKPSPCPPLPKSPLPAQVAASLGPRSHDGGAQEGHRKRDRKGRK